MKRYFIVSEADHAVLMQATPDEKSPGYTYTPPNSWHAIDLGSHGTAGAGFHALMVDDSLFVPPSTWRAWPHLLDAPTVVPPQLQALLADCGVLPTHNTFQAARLLGAILRHLMP